MRTFLYGTLTGFILALAIASAWFFGRPDPPDRTRIIYRDRPAPKELRVPPVAWRRYIYRVRVDTVRYCAPVPVDLDPSGVIGPEPIDVRRRWVALRYWSPDSLRWIEDRYQLKPPRWGAWVDVTVGRLDGYFTAAALNVRRDRWSAFVGPALHSDGGASVYFGIRRDVLGLR